MDIDNITIGEAKQLFAMFGSNNAASEHPYEVGENYFIRTVTHYFTGRLTAVFNHELVLEDVAWIADTGRYHEALAGKGFEEIEPYPEGSVVLGRGAIIDAHVITIALPRTVK